MSATAHHQSHPSLVSIAWLADHSGAENLRLFDCTVHLRPADDAPYQVVSGREDYESEHIPGAAFLDLADDLSDPDSALRFTLPSDAALSAGLGAAGISADHKVVLYASNHPMWATRAWWMLASAGHPNVAILDGGLAAWKRAGGRLRNGSEHYPAAQFEARVDRSWWADRDEVLASIGSESVCTLNALPAPMHDGSAPISYGRPGHIAGSVNVPFENVLSDEHEFKSPEAILASHAQARSDQQRTILYCGGGIGATVNAFALRLAGADNIAIYDGSLSEWASDPELPMSTA